MNAANNYIDGQQGFGAIFLIGFMGSGKTHWGKIWAAKNQLSFVDLDELIEKEAGKTIAVIFEKWGEDHFRKIEAAALRTSANLRNTIVACGGGTPCFYENIEWMNEHGTTIYIAATPAEIAQRLLSEQVKRPLLKNLNSSELILFTEQKLMERTPFYNKARLTVQSGLLNENSLPMIVSKIIA
jgi:shikimate kinase